MHICVHRCDCMKNGRRVFQFSLCLLSVRLMHIHMNAEHKQKDKVSVCVRMKDPVRQMERERKRRIESKKTPSYSCLPLSLHLFVSFLSVCSPHSRRSTLVTVFGDGEDRKGKIMCRICIIFPQLGPAVLVNLCCVTRGYSS